MLNMERWQSELDRELEKMLNQEDVTNLPGAGKPLNLGDETYVPDEMRMAYRILAQNDMAPDWVMMSKEIEQSVQKLRDSIATHVRAYRDGLAHAQKTGSATYRQNAEGVWQNAQKSLEGQAKAHNDMVLSFNLKAPKGVHHHVLFDLAKESAKQK
jgi:DnaJ homolog subfamily C member 28